MMANIKKERRSPIIGPSSFWTNISQLEIIIPLYLKGMEGYRQLMLLGNEGNS